MVATQPRPAAGPTAGNPALRRVADPAQVGVGADRTMSVAGTSIKTLVFLVVLVAGAAYGWASATESVAVDLGSGYGNTTVTIPGGFWLASFAALFLGIFISFSPRLAAPLGLVYALLQGYCLGAISAAYDAQTEGIVGAAILSTVAVFVAALFLYLTGIVRPTQRLAFALVAGICGLLLFSLFVSLVSIFDWTWLYSEEFRTIGIVVLLISVALAALSLTFDFATIAAGTEMGAPKQFEWYAAWGLMVTLIWLYVTLLRLLALLARNR